MRVYLFWVIFAFGVYKTVAGIGAYIAFKQALIRSSGDYTHADEEENYQSNQRMGQQQTYYSSNYQSQH